MISNSLPTRPLNVGIIGAGLIGTRRARVAASNPNTHVSLIVDVDLVKARALANELNCDASQDWRKAVSRPGLDLIVVSVPTELLTPVSLAAIEHGKHVLVEKPVGRNAEDIRRLVDLAATKTLTVQAGFTIRHHGHIRKAKEAVAQGLLGRLLWGRCVYGHGGRLGYEEDWRCQPGKVEGGELLDQGIHAVDLFNWFFGAFDEVFAYTATSFWKIAPLDDNAFGLMTTREHQTASFHVSWTLWKNQFSFEVFGELGYIKATGLGGGYGPEQLVIGTRAPRFGVPSEQRFEFSNPAKAWEIEWEEFVKAVKEQRDPVPSLKEAWEAMRLIGALYLSAREGTPQKISRRANA